MPLTKTDNGGKFPVRVYYEDTDAGGVVYYANYLKFAERGRTEWLRGIGANHRTLAADHGLVFVVKSLSVDYRASAKLDDLLEVQTELVALGAATLDMRQIIRHEDKTLAVMAVKLAAIDTAGKVLRLPRWLREAATGWVKSKPDSAPLEGEVRRGAFSNPKLLE